MNESKELPESPDLLSRQDSDGSWHPSQEQKDTESDDTAINKNQVFLIGPHVAFYISNIILFYFCTGPGDIPIYCTFQIPVDF